jgi:sugar phosphate isomerase/epimerase
MMQALNPGATLEVSRDFSLAPLSVLQVGPPALIDLAADAGFHRVGIRVCSPMVGGPEWPLKVGSAELRETLTRMKARGVGILDIEVVRIAAETDVERYVPAFESAAALGAERACVNIDDPDRSRAIDRFGALCDIASPFGLSLDVEFMVWRPVARLEDAVAIVEAAGRSNGKLLIDALHLDRSGGTPAMVAALDPSLIGSVQLCDATKKRPQSSGIIDEARGGRLAPGEGDLPLGALLDALPPHVPLAAEVPLTRSMPDATPLERVLHIRVATERFLRDYRARRGSLQPHDS